MKNTIMILNGPNLNLLGLREPDIYGTTTLADVEKMCRTKANEYGFDMHFHQSNAEHELIDFVHQARDCVQAIIINPASYSHTSIALLDALKAYSGLVVEVHISNIYHRESFRHHSFISMRADCVISGCGVNGYLYAINYVVDAALQA